MGCGAAPVLRECEQHSKPRYDLQYPLPSHDPPPTPCPLDCLGRSNQLDDAVGLCREALSAAVAKADADAAEQTALAIEALEDQYHVEDHVEGDVGDVGDVGDEDQRVSDAEDFGDKAPLASQFDRHGSYARSESDDGGSGYCYAPRSGDVDTHVLQRQSSVVSE